ncbi:unnamed protein product [Prunus armeniaca]|uniref:Protein HIRA-like C-terminal domain-containing protein n=1 Tax=Prunus armeniaca TaxID=36596 RepID=A0A6J5Y3C7_PRUAR|nr:unnamed protein product [Prunus armeniaca]
MKNHPRGFLQTLRDHFGSVNCVRWAKHGTTEFGSGEPPDVENWKVAMTLRGHTADVVDLNWSPDDSMLASGSLDNTIHIWNMSNASQSDDKTVIIWRTSDWSLAHRTDGHWAKSLGSTFFRRLGWSPCGHFITTTHGFQKPRHSAPVLERGEWSATFDFLGHNAPVIVVKFNHSMFRRNISNAQEKAAPVGWTNGASKMGGKEKEPQPYKSPDGYSLFACSLDGSVATFHFEVKELGNRLTDAELDELKRNRYGDVRGRQANLAESPAQLLLEAASAKQAPSKKVVLDQQNQTVVKPSVDARVATKTSVDGLNKASLSARISSPVKQREYRRPDGRKRIIPEAVGVPLQQENISVGPQSQALDFPPMPSDKKNDDNGLAAADSGIRDSSVRGTLVRSTEIKEGHGVTARAMITKSLVIEKVTASTGRDESITVEQSGNAKASSSLGASCSTLSIRVFDKKEGEDTVPICLEAQPENKLQTTLISGKVTVLAGNANFWAVGCEDGCIQVYTKCGRRAMPTMMRNCLLHDSLASLVASNPNPSAKDAGVIKVISAKLSRSGSPLVVLATRHAFLFDMGLMCWLRVADDCFPGSNFSSSWHSGSTQSGELAALQVDVRKYVARKPGWTDDGVQTRAHLEAQLASSLALKSPKDYRHAFFHTYASLRGC